MKRGHFSKSPKGKGGFHKSHGDKRRKSGGRGGATADSAEGTPNRRNRSRSGGFQEFGNFLWTFDETTSHWVARESSSSSPPASAAIDTARGTHSKAALRELNDFGREFPPAHKGKKGRGGNNNTGGRRGNKPSPYGVADDHDDHAFVGFRSDASDTAPRNRNASSYNSSPPAGGASSFAMRFVKGETMNDARLMKEEDDLEEGMATPEVKVEVKIEVKMEPEEDDKPAYLDATGRARPIRWQSEPAIPKFAPIVSPSRAAPQLPPATPQPFHPSSSGRGRGGAGRGRGRGRGGQLSASPSSPADFHYSYTAPEVAIAIKQETMLEDDNVTDTSSFTTTTTSTIAIASTQVEAPVAKPAQATDRKASSAKKNKKNEKKWKNRQLKNKHAFEPMDSDAALFTTRDVVRAKMQAGGFDKALGESSEEDEENAQADEDFLFGRGGRETRKGAPVRGKKKAPQQKGKKKGFVYDEDDEESDDDGMVLDEELIRDYMLNTNLASLNLGEEELEEQMLLHIVSQINDYHLTDDEDDEDDDDDDDDEEDSDDDDDDDEEEDDDDDSDEEGEEEDDSEEDFYDEYGDDEKEEEREQAKLKLKAQAAKAKAKTPVKTPHGLASWDDAETAAVVGAAAEEEAAFDAVLHADFTLLRSAAYEERPPGFQQRLRKQGGGGGGGGGSWPGRDDRQLQRAYQGRGKKWKTPERGGRGRQTKKGKWYDREFNEETITDEEELPYIDRTPLKGQPRSPSGMVTVHSINEAIRNFINNGNKEWLELPPMNKKQRVMVHQLANLYHLESKSYGMGRHRFPTLVKTIYTCLPPQTELLTFLNRAAKIKATNGAPQPKRLSKEENKQLRKLKNMRKRDGGKETFVSTKRAMDGTVVGEGATPVGQETIGARLLLSMGWTGGGLVGTNGEGIAEPLVAIVKNNRKGLGF